MSKHEHEPVQINLGEQGEVSMQQGNNKPVKVEDLSEIPWWARLHLQAYAGRESIHGHSRAKNPKPDQRK